MIRPDAEAFASLKNEVTRFMTTNTFHPIEVTNFYIQAKIVLSDYERMQQEIKDLKETLEVKNNIIYVYRTKTVVDLEKAIKRAAIKFREAGQRIFNLHALLSKELIAEADYFDSVYANDED